MCTVAKCNPSHHQFQKQTIWCGEGHPVVPNVTEGWYGYIGVLSPFSLQAFIRESSVPGVTSFRRPPPHRRNPPSKACHRSIIMQGRDSGIVRSSSREFFRSLQPIIFLPFFFPPLIRMKISYRQYSDNTRYGVGWKEEGN